MRDRELFAREMEVLSGGGDFELPSAEREIQEEVKQGASHYLALEPEKYRDKIAGREPDAKYAPIKQVGVFVPPAARTASEVDVLVFLHGHITECGITERSFAAEGIRALWNSKHFICLRQAIIASGKPVLLIVPKMDPWVGKNKGAAGYLNFDKEMVFYAMVRAAFKELVALGELAKDADWRMPNVAAFGAGGEPLQQIVMNSGVQFPKICIGFETLSFGHEVWRTWSRCQGTILYHYRRKGWNEKFMSTWFKRGIADKLTTDKTRCEMFCRQWPDALTHIVISGASRGVSPELEVPNPSRTGTSGTNTPTFVVKTWSLQTTPTKLVATGNRKAYHAAKAAHPAWRPDQLPAFVQIQQAPSTFLKTIIRRAGALARTAGKTTEAAILDPDTWFKQFTRIPFLGREFNKYEYVHVEFAKKLQEVENALVQQLGGTAQTVGNTVLFNSTETHPASRAQSATAAYSFHMFGLAIDVNYFGNPFVENSDVDILNGVLKRASELLRADTLRYSRPRGSGPANYDVVERLDQLLEQYFALLDDTAGLQAKIAAATRGAWRGISERDARRKIQKDVDNLSVALERRFKKGTKPPEDFRPYFKTHAILNFDKRLVVAMDNAALDWGASYGDMMHFDMRTTGVGAFIRTAIGEHKAKAERQMTAKLNAHEHGYHAFVD
jgi:hypothetical protein